MGGKFYCSGHERPKCCIGCPKFDWDSKDEYSPSYYYCELNLFLPTNKQTCKRKPNENHNQRNH